VNPTLTIIANALRVADHLRDVVGASHATTPAESVMS
jgi:choline dehydrogenase-like flavoprotein